MGKGKGSRKVKDEIGAGVPGEVIPARRPRGKAWGCGGEERGAERTFPSPIVQCLKSLRNGNF